MDRRAAHPLHAQLPAALWALLPEAQQGHPDASALAVAPSGLASAETALLRLVDLMALSTVEHAAALCALWTELDAGWAAGLSLLQGGGPGERPGPSWPTPGLVAALAPALSGLARRGSDGTRSAALARLLAGPALASGLLQLGDTNLPLHARTLRWPGALLPLLLDPATTPASMGFDGCTLTPVAAPHWPLPARWQRGLRELAATLSDATGPTVLLLRVHDAAEAAALAAALAQALGRRPWAVDAETAPALPGGLVPALHLLQALPVCSARASPGQAEKLPHWPLWPGPLLWLADADSALDTTRPQHGFEPPAPTPDEQRALWAALRPQAGDAELGLAAQARCGWSVLAEAATSGADDARQAIGAAVARRARTLSAWARVSDAPVPPEAWVGAPSTQQALALLRARCQARESAARSLGPLLRGRLPPGVKALFIGASGTGKTLAAQWLADRLGRPLLRVDLAAVVSKYIGETEKNLSQLLTRAEHLDAVLLFDEADSLFGARTDVKQANDRYANMQTNYLLQRLECFRGVVLLTSNSKARFDDAFLRRLDAVLEFALPDVAERRALWALHLGDAARLDAAFMNRVAAIVDLPGGHIRNAALTAALLARQRAPGDTDPAIEPAELRLALTLEYAKLGQRVPDALGSG